MKKILSICAALLIAFAANATVKHITPTTPYGTDNLRKALYYCSNVGGWGYDPVDTIMLASGTYEESNENYIAFLSDVVVMAESGAVPVIHPRVSFTISGGVKAKMIGIKVNADSLTNKLSSYSNLFYAADASDNNRMIFEDCEFYNNKSKVTFRCESSKKLDSLIINNCKIHDNQDVILWFESSSLKGLTITNTTIYNTKNASPYWASHISVSGSTAAKVLVDHCTFYNCHTVSSSYADVKVTESTDVTVSNCIFVQPSSAGWRATNIGTGNHVNNCITLNYAKSTERFGHEDGPTLSNCSFADPLFADTAHADFTLLEGSPALGTATDGGNLGDKRWWPAIPQTPTTVYLNPGVWNGDGAKYAIYAYEPGKESQWSDFLTPTVERPSIYTGTVPAGYSHLIFVRLKNTTTTPNWDDKWNQSKNQTIVEGGKDLYTITGWGEGDGTWSTYLVNGFYLIGQINGVGGWDIASISKNHLLKANPSNASEYMITVNLIDGDQLKVVDVANGAISTWYPDGEGTHYPVYSGYDGLRTIYFRPAGDGGTGWHYNCIYNAQPTYEIGVLAHTYATLCLPYAATLTNGKFYSVKTASAGAAEIIIEEEDGSMVAGKPYIISAINPSAAITATLSGDKVDEPIANGIMIGNLSETPIVVAPDANNYVLKNDQLHLVVAGGAGDKVTVGQYKAYFHTEAALAPAAMFVVEGENNATAIENLDTNDTAVKFIQNGKLYILREGVVYDATGKMVK